MNSKLAKVGLYCTILAGALYTIPALAEHQLFSPAQICLLSYSSDTNASLDDLGRISNNSTTGNLRVHCGLGQDQVADSNDDIVIRFADANTAQGKNVSCGAVEFSDDGGTMVWTNDRMGCSTAGGCTPSSTSTYSGSNYILLNDILHGGAYTTSLFCLVPMLQSGGNPSNINNILLYESAGGT